MIADLCGDLTVIINSTLSIFWSELPTPYFEFPGSAPSYLRPGGEALQPWAITLIVLIVHLPVVVLRVVKWEIVQTWSFVFTGFTILLYVQAYVSTNFDPGDVLVWTPLMLIIDAGSMSQMYYLINEDIYLAPWAKRMWKGMTRKFRNFRIAIGKANSNIKTTDSSSSTDTELESQVPLTSGDQPQVLEEGTEGTNLLANAETQTEALLAEEPKKYLISGVSSILAILFFIAIIVLQLLGLVHAIWASESPDPPQVQWCSPLFQPVGVVVRDGNCNIHTIDQSFNRGIGCVNLPGIQQQGWIIGTIWGTSISLILELGDVLILSFTHKKTRWRGMKMRRPWCTIITGVVVLGTLLFFGIIYSKDLPGGITERVWIVMRAGDELTVYQGHLVSAGLRGEFIGWLDALFKSWSATYFGVKPT